MYLEVRTAASLGCLRRRTSCRNRWAVYDPKRIYGAHYLGTTYPQAMLRRFRGERARFTIAVLSVLSAGYVMAEAVKSVAPKLSATQVSKLAAGEWKKQGSAFSHYSAQKPQFRADFDSWLVFYVQSSPPYAPDGTG